MLTPRQITELAADLESYHVERKESFKSVKGAVEEAICAFANDLPGSGRTGVILIGVSDRTGPAKPVATTATRSPNLSSRPRASRPS